MTTANILSQLGSPGVSTGFKNRIINGAMVIDQRNAGASVTPAATSTYSLDRWVYSTNQASKVTIQQNAGSVTPPVGFTNYLGVTVISSYSLGASDYNQLMQLIEGYNISDLGWGTADAKTVTLSFWVRSSLTGTFGGSIRNGSINRSYPFTYTISAANTWQQISITVAGDTSGTWLSTNGIGMYINFSQGAGTSLSGPAGAWAGTNYSSATGATSIVGTNGATFYITGVQLEVGTTATNFDYRSYGTELALCQRYYAKIINSADGNVIASGLVWSGATSRFAIVVPQQMRATPSGGFSGTSYLYGANSFKQVTALSGVVANSSGYRTTISIDVTTATAMPNTNALVMTLEGTGSYYEFSAEL